MSGDSDADFVRRKAQTGMALAMMEAVEAAKAAKLDPVRASAILLTVLNDLTSGVISSLPQAAHEPMLVECNASLRRLVAVHVVGPIGTVQ